MKHCVYVLVPAVLASAAFGGPKFEDAASAFPETHIYAGGWEHFVGGGVAVFDCNEDGQPDIFAAGGANPTRLFINRLAADRGFELGKNIPTFNGVTGAVPLDIDSDGIVDLAILRVGENVLLRGRGACHFDKADWGFETSDRWSTAFSATWEQGQTWPTLAIGNYVDRHNPDGPFEACDTNLLYRPEGQGFASPLPLEPGFCALSMLFSDWARTGRAELRISNDRHYYVRGGYEQMWQMQPLQERSEGWDRVSIWGMGIASADLQRDGYPDVMLTSMGDQVLHWNEGGRILPGAYDTGTTAHRPHVGDDGRPSTGWHAEFADIDNDGLLDLFIAKGNVDQMPGLAIQDPNNLLMQHTEGHFVEASVEAGLATTARSRGGALADFDGDGRLDIVVINRRAPMELWLNRSEETGNWAKIDLKQDRANRYAVGAWLEIERDGTSEWRERTIGGGHVSGSLLPFHIGLGEAEVLRLRVWWPDGTATQWQEFPANTLTTLVR